MSGQDGLGESKGGVVSGQGGISRVAHSDGGDKKGVGIGVGSAVEDVADAKVELGG